MIARLLILALCTICLPSAADQATLDYLYEPELEQKQKLLLDRVLNHGRNAEFDYALTLSQTLLDDAELLRETSAARYGQILINHGIIQSAAGDYEQALPVIERGLAFMELHTNPFSLSLVNGVIAKALTELGLDNDVDAEDSLRRAQHIMHRQNGVYAADQLQLIEFLTKTNLKRGDLSGADRQQRFSLKVAEQVYGPDSIELLPMLSRLGGYFATRGSTIPPLMPTDIRLQRDLLFKYSVSMYQRAVTIIEQNFGENDLRLVQPLRGLANARMLQITNRKYAEAALERSLEIVQSNPDSDITDRAQALVDLGDLYTITSDGRASQVYLEAWDLLQATPETQDVAIAFFGSPVRLHPRSDPVLYLERRPDAADIGTPLYVNIEYSVNSDGKVSRVKVIERNVPNEQVRLLRHRVRSARFRPRIMDAEIVPTEGLMLHQTFQVIRDRGIETASVEPNTDAVDEESPGDSDSDAAPEEPLEED